jgi:cholesterol transport system auxiliary component
MPSRVAEVAGMSFMIVAMAGCVLPRAAEGPLHTYLLKPDNGAWNAQPSGNKHEAQSVLLLSPPQAEPGFDTPRMVYLTRPHEISYYATNQWAETLPRMMQSLLLQSLEKSGLWRVVVPIPSPVRGDYRLDSLGLALQQELSQPPSKIRVSLRLQLVRLRDQQLVGTRRLEVVEPAPTDDAYGGVVAANRAVAMLLDQVTTWLATCVSEGPSGRC